MIRLLQGAALMTTVLGHSFAQMALPPKCTYMYSQQNTVWNGNLVLTELYAPQPAPIGTVVMIHGSAGALTRTKDLGVSTPPRDNFGESKLAASCFTVIFPHYLEAIGLKSLTDRLELSRQGPELIRFLSTILDSTHREHGSAPIFLYGQSYGGYLAVALASKRRDIRAVSEFGGGLPEVGLGETMPPLLIQHGMGDMIVPIYESARLRDWAQKYTTAKAIPYPDQGHYFDDVTRDQVLKETTAFFVEHLSLPKSEKKSRRKAGKYHL